MTSNQINLIKTTWQIAAMKEEQLASLFYKRLFEIAPEVEPLFNRTPIPEQSKKLSAALSLVIGKLDVLEDISGEIAKLGQRHIKYGVEEKHYDQVGAALLWTLETALENNWTEEIKQAWTACYETLSKSMINAAGSAKQEVA